jgi:CheY-like chemotaxis protein
MPKTLLLADDSVTIQKVVGISFANEDVVLLTVDNGDDAVLRAREARPDLVLADVAMPGKDGYEVCEAIKADPELRHVPVLLLSGTFESFDEARARHAGADGHITKPFEAQALVDRVNELLAHAESARSVGGSDTTVLVSERPATSGDAFDFFDEEFAATSPSTAAAPKTTALFEDDGGASLSAMPIELESAVEDEIAEASEAVAIASFDDDDIDPPSDAGHATTVLFDDSESTNAQSSGSTRVEPSGSMRGEPARPDPFAQTHSSAAATQLLDDSSALAAPPPVPTTSFDEAFDFGFEDEPESLAAAPAPPPSQRDTAAIEDAFEVAAEPAQELFESELDAPVATPPPVPSSAPARAAADVAIPSGAHIEVMRQEIHQHLEKIAWEAFGDLSERIVRETVARIEAIAWEVIPQMAETLVREEIRKLQDDE